MKNRKTMAILLCVVMLFALAACGGGGGSTSPSAGSPAPSGSTDPGGSSPAVSPAAPAAPGRDTLTISAQQDTGTLDPVGVSGLYLNVLTTYMEPLFDYKSGMEIVWLLATGIDEVTPTQWTVHLREGVTFSNGNPLTAEDVLFTLELYRDTPARALNVQSIDFENTKKIDDHTIDLRLTVYNIAQKTSLSTMMIVDAESYDPESFSLNPIGTGPYIVTDYTVNSHLNLTARDDYWGAKPAIPNLVFKVLNEDSQRVNAIQTGTVDVATIPTQDIDFAETLSGFNVVKTLSASCTMVMFSTSEASLMGNVEARYAVAHAIDRQAIASLVYSGHASVTDNPVSMAALDYEPRFGNLHETYSIGYNPELAKQYAESAGIVGKEISIMTNGAAEYVAMAEIMQANLKEIGVNVKINNYDQATLRSLFRTDPASYDICLYYTAAPSMLGADLVFNNVRFSSILNADGAWEGVERFMELGVQVLGNPDEKSRSDELFEMYQLFTKACPWFGVCDLMSAFAFSTDLNDPEIWGLGNVRYQEMSFAS